MIEMLLPIIDFFNKWLDLDDSYGEGGKIVSNWTGVLKEAISLLDHGWENDSLIEELLESAEKTLSYFSDDLPDLCNDLRGYLIDADNDDEDSNYDKPTSKRWKHF